MLYQTTQAMHQESIETIFKSNGLLVIENELGENLGSNVSVRGQVMLNFDSVQLWQF